MRSVTPPEGHGGGGDRGLTLLELVIAVFVLALGSLAALRVADQSRLAIGGAETRLLAELAARNRLEELRLLGGSAPALPDEVVLAGQAFRLESTRAATAGGFFEITVTARGETGTGAQLTGWLPPGTGR